MRILHRDRNDNQWNVVDRKHYPLYILESGATPEPGDVVTVGETWNSNANMQRCNAQLPDGLRIERNPYDAALGTVTTA